MTRRIAALMVGATLLAACGGGGDTGERTRNVALEVSSVSLPFAATNAAPYEILWSEAAGRAVVNWGDENYEGLWTGATTVLKTSDPLDESVPTSFPVDGTNITTALPDGAGGWFVGGSTMNFAQQGLRKLAHVKPNGDVDAGFSLDYKYDERLGWDQSTVSWLGEHPDGEHLLALVHGMESVGGADLENACPQLVVLNRVTGARNTGLEPDAGTYGCAYHPAIVGKRLILGGSGRGEGSPLLWSIDLTSNQFDDFVEGVNVRFPWFTLSNTVFRSVSDVVVRDGSVWVFGLLDGKGTRVARIDAATGALSDFDAGPVQFNVEDESSVNYAVSTTHVMMHARELDENAVPVDNFKVFDAATGAAVKWTGEVNGWGWTWAVSDVQAWQDDFLLVGQMRSVNGRPVRGLALVGPSGATADRQLPLTLKNTNVTGAYVEEFPGVDRTVVSMEGTGMLFDAFHTGPVLVTDRDGAPVDFPLGDTMTGRSVSAVGVIDEWLYVASLDLEVAGYGGSRLDRYDLSSGERDAGWMLDTSGRYVSGIHGDGDHLAVLQVEAPNVGTEMLALHRVAGGERIATVTTFANGGSMNFGEGTVSGGHLFIRTADWNDSASPVLIKVKLADGTVTEAPSLGEAQFSFMRATVHEGKVYLPWNNRIEVLDEGTLVRTGSVDVDYAYDVVFVDGRMLVAGSGVSEVDPATLEVTAKWGPSSVSLSRLVGTRDGVLSGMYVPWAISESVVGSGVLKLGFDGTVVTKKNHARLRREVPAADEQQVTGPAVQAQPYPDALPVTAVVVPQVQQPAAVARVSPERVSILDVQSGDRSVTVRFRSPAASAGHTVRVVGGKQSCTTRSDACQVNGLTAGVEYRFVVVPDSDAALASPESGGVRPWVSMKKGSSKKVTSLHKVGTKGKVAWKVKGASCSLKGTTISARKKGMCTLMASVRTSKGTVRTSVNVRVV